MVLTNRRLKTSSVDGPFDGRTAALRFVLKRWDRPDVVGTTTLTTPSASEPKIAWVESRVGELRSGGEGVGGRIVIVQSRDYL